MSYTEKVEEKGAAEGKGDGTRRLITSAQPSQAKPKPISLEEPETEQMDKWIDGMRWVGWLGMCVWLAWSETACFLHLSCLSIYIYTQLFSRVSRKT